MRSEGTPIEISFPKIVVDIELAGSNSLLGGLCKVFREKDYLKYINVLNPDEIVFVIKKVHKELNLYHEINLVRDVFKIDEKKITVLISEK